MRRREFITFLGAAAASCPLAARAQQNGSPRVAALMAFKEDDPEEQLRINALREGLQASDGVNKPIFKSTGGLRPVISASCNGTPVNW